MAGMHRSRALGLSIAVMGLVTAAGCLTLTTAQDGGGGNAGAGSSGSADSSGSAGSSGGACKTVEDCPPIMLCQTMACAEGVCVPGFVPKSVSCNDNKVCDGNGSCVDCVVNNDCSGNSPTCENNQCISCSDGVKNGEETDVDCGGSKCSPCTMPCTNASECASGHCVDGVCCNNDCTAECKSCNVAGKVGTCASLPMGTEDPGLCDTTKACSGGFQPQCLLKNGQLCADDTECLSNECDSTTNICEND